jgi:hypothetical protein
MIVWKRKVGAPWQAWRGYVNGELQALVEGCEWKVKTTTGWTNLTVAPTVKRAKQYCEETLKKDEP